MLFAGDHQMSEQENQATTGPAHARPSRRARRKERAAARTKGWRWGRRAIATVVSLVVITALVVGAGYWYVNYRLDQIPRVGSAKDQLHHSPPGAPFDVLLIGSDTRQFENKNGSSEFGSSSVVTGQRSDVTIIARVIPAEHQVYLLSIPRDTLVNIPGHVPYISGQNRINAAFNSGPGLLIKTIKADFGIPIDHFAEINFAGFQGMVNAVGGIKIDFPYRLKDSYSNLSIDHRGCQLIHGAEALAFVRSRHLYYKEHGTWLYDGMSDWSRIRRQDVFFRALVDRVKSEALNLPAMNSLLISVVRNLTLDSNFTNSDLLSLVYDFRHAGVGNVHSEVLPTIPYIEASGANVLLQAKGPDEAMIKKFMAEGTKPAKTPPTTSPSTTSPGSSTSSTSSTSTTTTTTTSPSSSVVFDTQPEPWNGTPC
jgi:LCP family protein required for cell wall assembly